MTVPALKLGSTPQPKVYVVQEPLFKDKRGQIRSKFDLSPAEAYGELNYVLNWSDPLELDIRQMLWKIRKALLNFTENDYLLMVGNPTAMALTAAVANERTDGCFRLLYWDNMKEEYRADQIDMHAQPL